MATNDERRKVAENLRIMRMFGCRYKEQFYDLLDETVMNDWDFHEFHDVADRLADLIEPEPERTCHPVIEDETGVCSNCGEDIDWYGWSYCPNCGRRIVEQ